MHVSPKMGLGTTKSRLHLGVVFLTEGFSSLSIFVTLLYTDSLRSRLAVSCLTCSLPVGTKPLISMVTLNQTSNMFILCGKQENQEMSKSKNKNLKKHYWIFFFLTIQFTFNVLVSIDITGRNHEKIKNLIIYFI